MFLAYIELLFSSEQRHVDLRCAAGDGNNISDVEGRSSRDNGGHEGSGDD